jgi:DNA-binding NtrC family response regulator
MLDERRIGIVEDDGVMGEALAECFRQEGAHVALWNCGGDALAGLTDFDPEIIVCDIRLPDLSGEQIFGAVSARLPAVPFLFVTGYGRIDEAVRLMRHGAGDYITKPFELPPFLERVRELLPARERAEVGALGRSPAMLAVEATLRRVAAIRSTVLLLGETGSGKEVAARFLHEIGRPGKPFVAVNCAAFPPDLLESELFGHERGAFTGAAGRHIGQAERAGDGTLFLDEVAELRLSLQAKLLRLLDERRFSRVGGGQTIDFRARVVAATNADLAADVAKGVFRQDLYFRLDVISVRLPPLRERQADIVPLMERFRLAYVHEFGNGFVRFEPETFVAAMRHAWPGNVRELRNRVERAVALAAGPAIRPIDLFPEATVGNSDEETPQETLSAARDLAERRQIEEALRATGNQVLAAAQLLAVSRTTLWKKMRRLGIRTSLEA